MSYLIDRQEYVPRYKAKQLLKIDDVQLSIAMRRGLIRHTRAYNTHNRAYFDLIHVGDLLANKEEIQAIDCKDIKDLRLW